MANSNFAVLNPLTKGTRSSLSLGNLKHSSTTADLSGLNATFGVTTGKWYWEIYNYDSGSGFWYLGINSGYEGGGHYYQGYSNLNGMVGGAIRYRDNGTIDDQSSSDDPDRWGTISVSSTGVSTIDNGDIVMVALDYDNSKIWFGKNGTFFNSGNPATGTNAQGSWDGDVPIIFPIIESYHNNTQTVNFGQDSSFAGAKSTGTAAAADGNGFGDFYYTPPSGYLALCSGNQTTSTNIDPAETDDEISEKQCSVVTYTGNGGTNSITGLGFQPDMVWIKSRTSGEDPSIYDSTRGVGKRLKNATTEAESTVANGFTAFGTDGFTVGAATENNANTENFVAWCWRANGGTTSTNNDGTGTSTVQANQAAGFSIVQFPNYSGDTTFGHGLSSTPEFIIAKLTASGSNFPTFHSGFASGKTIHLNTNTAEIDSSHFGHSGTGNPVSGTTFTLGASFAGSGAGIAYVWHSVDGYSKFGSYTGNGETGEDGPFIFTGFRPRIFFIKRLDGTRGWTVVDSETYPRNNRDGPERIEWNSNSAAVTGSSATREMDFLSNGVKLRTSNTNVNVQDAHYIFGAWGDVPFKYNNTR